MRSSQQMIHWLLTLLCLCFSFPAIAQTAILLNAKGPISPASSDYIQRNLKLAAEQKAEFIILSLDTPGGLETSMRDINKTILASSIPVVAYVAPEGARAASAGTFIVYASHVAVMAPGTNIGAASPVEISEGFPGEKEKSHPPSTLEKKGMNDAAAYIRSLAKLRGRNSDWAEKAVTQAVSISAEEALQLKVIDFIASDIPDLLTKLNNRTITIQGQTQTLETKNIKIITVTPDWRYQLLSVLTDPSIAYILFLLGIYGLFFELYNPGFVLPGVLGAIALLLALYAFQLLPVSYTGFALLILGIGLLVSEIFISSFGILGIGGLVAFILGSIFLMDSTIPGFTIAWQIILVMSIATIAFFLVIINLAVSSKFKKVVSGKEALIGKEGVVLESTKASLWVRIDGEIWQARSSEPLQVGQKIRVTQVIDLQLIVVPISDKRE